MLTIQITSATQIGEDISFSYNILNEDGTVYDSGSGLYNEDEQQKNYATFADLKAAILDHFIEQKEKEANPIVAVQLDPMSL